MVDRMKKLLLRLCQIKRSKGFSPLGDNPSSEDNFDRVSLENEMGREQNSLRFPDQKCVHFMHVPNGMIIQLLFVPLIGTCQTFANLFDLK